MKRLASADLYATLERLVVLWLFAVSYAWPKLDTQVYLQRFCYSPWYFSSLSHISRSIRSASSNTPGAHNNRTTCGNYAPLFGSLLAFQAVQLAPGILNPPRTAVHWQERRWLCCCNFLHLSAFILAASIINLFQNQIYPQKKTDL